MTKKPLFFTLVPLIFAALALSFPLQIMVGYDLSLSQPWAIVSKLTPLNIALMTSFAHIAYMTFAIKSSIFHFLPIVGLLVMMNNYFVATLSEIYTPTQTTLASLIFVGLISSFYKKEIYRCFHQKNFRWWQTTPRKKISIPLTLYSSDNVIKTRTFDISQTGLFAKNDSEEKILQMLKGEELSVIIHLEDSDLHCRAKVVRKTLGAGRYPSGIGINFSHINTQHRGLLQKCAA